MTRKGVLTHGEFAAVNAWWQAGTMKGAAELLGVAPRTVVNQLFSARRVMGVDTNALLVQALWKSMAAFQNPKARRKLRYDMDPQYREKQRGYAREAMRRKRAAESSEKREVFDRLIEAQNGKCAICGGIGWMRRNADGLPVRLAVDHDHKTGAVRELLCTGCNMMLGCASDTAELLEAGAKYLRKHAKAALHNNDHEAA